MNIHEKYLLRCLQIASNALGSTAPNPMVGAVVTYEDRIIGEGYTQPFGGAHAEVMAIQSVRDKTLLKKATLYVTLEPCCHFGKTPPCTDLIKASGIPRVVIGVQDPNDKVAGKGMEILQNAGCEVISGVLQQECEDHHRRFLTYHKKKRPYIILKWAESADRFIAPEMSKRHTDPQPYWLSGALSRQLAHKWRMEEAGILIGTNTALEDNPRLNIRLWSGPDPLRILIDRHLRVPQHFHLLSGHTKTMVISTQKAKDTENVLYRTVSEEIDLIPQLLDILWKQNLQSVIVEGGANTLSHFIRSGLWDEARIIQSPNYLGSGLAAPQIEAIPKAHYSSGPDKVLIFRNDT